MSVTARPVVWLQPKPQSVVLHQPNPVLGPDDLQVVDGELLDGDDLAVVAAKVRYTFSRNYPASNASETIGKTYKISAAGVVSAKYDIRYKIGTLTVVAPQ